MYADSDSNSDICVDTDTVSRPTETMIYILLAQRDVQILYRLRSALYILPSNIPTPAYVAMHAYGYVAWEKKR